MKATVTQVTNGLFGYDITKIEYEKVKRIYNDKEDGEDTITIIFGEDGFLNRATYFTEGLQIDFEE